MKLTDKRFWKFEAMMLLCGFLLLCQVVILLICNDAQFESCSGLILILLFLYYAFILLYPASLPGCCIKETRG